MRRIAVAVAALAAMSFASVASAAVTITKFSLDVYDPSAVSFTDASIGTITVTDNGIDMYIVAALNVDGDGNSLGNASTYEFRDGNADHISLVFQSDKTATLSGLRTNVLTTALNQVPPPLPPKPPTFSEPPFGSNWNYAVQCASATGKGDKAANGCLSGYTAPPVIPAGKDAGTGLNPTKISFHVAGIDFSDLKSTTYKPAGSTLTKNIWFAVDVIAGPPCHIMCTGNVGATWLSQTSYVPEPGTWALLILGFGAVGADLRRRRARALAA
jgi:hypothetical protein